MILQFIKNRRRNKDQAKYDKGFSYAASVLLTFRDIGLISLKAQLDLTDITEKHKYYRLGVQNAILKYKSLVYEITQKEKNAE